MGNTTPLTSKGPLPTGYCAVAQSPRHARSRASSRLYLLLPVSTVAAAVIFSGVTRAALVQSGNSGTAALNASASFAKASFDAESSAAMNRMMAGMDMNPTGDVGRDFVAMMVPHHQGAIDMAEAELRYGRNEQLLRVTQQIVVEQVQEIAAMRIAVGEEVSRDEALLAAAMPSASAAPAQAGVAKSARSLKA